MDSIHIINSHGVEIVFPEKNYAQEQLILLPDLITGTLMPQLENCLNTVDKKGCQILVDELELDLGVLSMGDWKEEFVNRTVKQFEEALRKKLSSAPSNQIAENPTDLSKDSTRDNNGARIIKTETNLFDQFISFLKSGIFDHSSLSKETDIWQGELIKSFELQDLKEKVRELHQLLREDSLALRRLILQFNDDFLNHILRDLVGEGLRNPEFEKTVFTFFSFKNKMQVKISPEQIEQTIKDSISDGKEKRLLAWSLKFFKGLNRINSGQKDLKGPVEIIADLVTKVSTPNAETGNLSKEVSESGNTKTSDPKLNTIPEVYIGNAGLVILHPFLPALFKNLGYRDEQGWLSEDLHEKAVLISQYLITEKMEIPEYDLCLNKIMCGFPIENPVSSQLGLSIKEIQEADDLLKSVVGYWKALKSTSPDALRSTFLQRKGKLVQESKGWLLRVEGKTWDVLMDQLPWGVSMIKNDFMTEWLYVEWN